jgi:hypothetical protein
VLLADGTTHVSYGGGFSETLRQRVLRLRYVDILIDSTRTLQRSILGWVQQATAESGKRQVVVDTEVVRSHHSLSALLNAEGYRLVCILVFAPPNY